MALRLEAGMREENVPAEGKASAKALRLKHACQWRNSEAERRPTWQEQRQQAGQEDNGVRDVTRTRSGTSEL